MKLGTVAYKNKIYNLDYMNIDELKELLKNIEDEKKENFTNIREVLKKD